MARRGTNRNELILEDKVSGSEIAFYYRLPTTRDRFRFETNYLKKRDNEIDSDLIAEQIEVGLEIITGIRDGDFEREVDGGEFVPVSSNPESPDYCPEWKDFLREYASDLLEWFTVYVFSGMRPKVKRGGDAAGK